MMKQLEGLENHFSGVCMCVCIQMRRVGAVLSYPPPPHLPSPSALLPDGDVGLSSTPPITTADGHCLYAALLLRAEPENWRGPERRGGIRGGLSLERLL